jgi:hypothetical protein
MRLLSVILVILVILYVYGYFKYPRKVAILQTNQQRFSPDILLERQPVVFEDDPPLEFIHTKVFKWGLVKQPGQEHNQTWQVSKYKYKAFKVVTDGELVLCPPAANTKNGVPVSDEQLIAIQCKKGNVVIIPYRWRYLCAVQSDFIGMHDLVTYLLP